MQETLLLSFASHPSKPDYQTEIARIKMIKTPSTLTHEAPHSQRSSNLQCPQIHKCSKPYTTIKQPNCHLQGNAAIPDSWHSRMSGVSIESPTLPVPWNACHRPDPKLNSRASKSAEIWQAKNNTLGVVQNAPKWVKNQDKFIDKCHWFHVFDLVPNSCNSSGCSAKTALPTWPKLQVDLVVSECHLTSPKSPGLFESF